MNKKDAYLRRQYIARRGAVPVRRSTPYYKDKQKRRELVPKYAKYSDQGFPHQSAYLFEAFKVPQMREGHENEKKLNRNRKNFRRTVHPIKNKRGYWDHGRERKAEDM